MQRLMARTMCQPFPMSRVKRIDGWNDLVTLLLQTGGDSISFDGDLGASPTH